MTTTHHGHTLGFSQPQNMTAHPRVLIAADGSTQLQRFDVAAVIYALDRERAMATLDQANIYLEAARVVTGTPALEPQTTADVLRDALAALGFTANERDAENPRDPTEPLGSDVLRPDELAALAPLVLDCAIAGLPSTMGPSRMAADDPLGPFCCLSVDTRSLTWKD